MSWADFRPREFLRDLGYHRLVGKSKPRQSLFWHCLNTYYCAGKLEELSPVRLNETDQAVLLIAALLHDTGKADECWQEKGSGGHKIGPKDAEQIDTLLQQDERLPHSFSQEEREAVIELIREHHIRETRTIAQRERLMDLLKLSDVLVSSTRITSRQIDMLGRKYSPEYVPLALMAEEHPLSYHALSVADRWMREDELGHLILANPLQSLYLVPAEHPPAHVQATIDEKVKEALLDKVMAEVLFVQLDSRVSTHPVQDERVLWKVLQGDPHRVVDEMRTVVEERQSRIESALRDGRDVDPDQSWYPPVKVLYRISKSLGEDNLLGTSMSLDEVADGRYPTFEEAKKVGHELGVKSPEELVKLVVEILVDHLPEPDGDSLGISEVTNLLMWSDEVLDARGRANQAYEHYKQTQWNSPKATSWSDGPVERRIKDYCFSCKSRPPSRKAPSVQQTIRPKVNTWVSSVADKKHVRVCNLCFIAQKYLLPEAEPGKFLVQFTPAYNQARIDWRDLLDEELTLDPRQRDYVSSHRVVLPLPQAGSPSEAVEALFQPYGHRDDQNGSIASFLYGHGLTAVVSAGPGHPGHAMISGMGLEIEPEAWEEYGGMLSFLIETSPREDVAPIGLWRSLRTKDHRWGTELAIRHRRDKLRKKETQEKVVRLTAEATHDDSLFARVRGIPLHQADRNERFKSIESVLRTMDATVRKASKSPDQYGTSDEDRIETIAQLGKKQLRNRIRRARDDDEWPIPNESLIQVEDALRSVATRLWELRENHLARNDLVNALAIATAYKPTEEDK